MRSSLIESRPVSNNNGYYARPPANFQRPVSSPPATGPKRQRRIRLVPSEGWLPFLLLAVAVYCVVYSVTAAITISHGYILWLTTALGLLCGLVVSKSRYFPQAVMHIASCILGYWLALALTSLLAYHVSLGVILANLRTVLTNGLALTGTPGGEMIFLFYLSFLCFFLGYFGSWLIYRAHLPWLVALVYISIMIVNLNYIAKRDLSFLIIILVAALIPLVARVHLANQLAQWRNEGLYTDQAWLRNLTARFIRIVTIFVLLILPFSWFLPVLSQPGAGVVFWNNLDNAWANLSHGNLSSLTNPGSLFSPYQPAANFFGDQLAITGNVNLPTGPVLSYTTGSAANGQYLEGFSFDHFDGHTWTSQLQSGSESYTPNSPLPLDNFPSTNHTSLEVTVTIIQPPGGTKHFIFAPAQPEKFTVPVTIYTDANGNFISAWTQNAPLQQNEHYQVTAAISDVSPDSLAGIPFPLSDPSIWGSDADYNVLRQYYLQVPKDISAEVQATAKAWTNGSANMYDAVAALQQHLSNPATFTYSVSNPPVPSNIDAVTWLLHTRKGYCTYYATAMVMMARLLGIPTRVVNGFSQGHYDSKQRAWIVDGNDAHSWVQVFFPGFGWANFDPTPGYALSSSGQPTAAPTVSPTKPPVSSSPTASPQKQQTPGTQPTLTAQPGGTTPTRPPIDNAGTSWFLVFSLLILFGSSIVLAASVIYYRRTSSSPRSAIASMYARLCRVSSLVGSPPARWQTPYEYTYALSKRFPQASTTLRRLADLFVRERWAAPQHAPASNEAKELERLWPRLRNTILRSPLSKSR